MTNDIRGTQPYDLVHSGEFPLTKREYFAAMAMQGLLANNPTVSITEEGLGSRLANWSIVYADALIDALNAEKK